MNSLQQLNQQNYLSQMELGTSEPEYTQFRV